MDKRINKRGLVIIIACGLFCLSASLHAQTRNTIWLDGLQTTSLGWKPNRYSNLKLYDFEDLVSTNLDFNAGYDPWLGVEGASNYLKPIVEGRENVLGIAHDYGGLVLRHLANNDDDEITAMILNGVPNQGSSAIQMAIGQNADDGDSRMQIIIDKVNDIKGDEGCEDCNIVGNFERWIDEIAHPNNRAVFEDMAPGVMINNLNANPPDIPYAIIWGSVDTYNSEQSIVNLMDSRGSITGFDNSLANCVAGKLREQQKKIEDDKIVRNVNVVLGLFGSVLDFASSLISGNVFGNPEDDENNFDTGGFLGAIGSFANDIKSTIVDYLDTNSELDQRLASLMRCETANQMLEVHYELAMMDAGQVEVELVDENLAGNLQHCEQYCWEQFEGSIPNHAAYGACIQDCLENNPAPPILGFVTPRHDLLLTEMEQKLPGQTGEPFHLFNHNHFQESRDRPGTNMTDLDYALEELFSGSVSPAFEIPKQ